MTYQTWKEIAEAVGQSERCCRDLARRELDPLPVYKVGGGVRLDQAELEAWLRRRRDRPFSLRSEDPRVDEHW